MSLPERIGPYEVVGALGQGGMGAVLRVKHPRLEAERALKLLLRVTPKQKERFERELLRLAQIRHPNVVGIHDSGTAEDGRPYFVMDLLDGRTLDAALLEDGPPDLEQALEWAIGICAGVQALHEQGIIHRDLKPQNILLTRDGRPVVLDVGLALDLERDERLTRTGALVGTLHYMAPEQLGKGEPSARTDVYALGLIVFELLTGTSAAPKGASTEVAAKIINQDRPLPGSVDGGLPIALDRISARATNRDPEQRYADAGELAAALRDVLDQPGLSRRTVRVFQGVITVLSLVLLAAVGLRVSGGGSATSTPEPTATAASGKERRAVLSELRRPSTAEGRAKAAAEWLAEHAESPLRGEVEAFRKRALEQWGRERLRELRGLKEPDAIYRAAVEWRETFGADHANAENVREVLAEGVRNAPVKAFVPAWFATFSGPNEILSVSRDGIRRWDLRTLRPVGDLVILDRWASRLNPARTGMFVGKLSNRRAISWYDLKTGAARPFVETEYYLRWVAWGQRGKQVSLRGFKTFELRTFPEGAVRYRHKAPVQITGAQADAHGNVAITYWGTLRHAVHPPPVLDVRRIRDDTLLKRHKLVGSGVDVALAADGHTVGCVTNLGRVYLFDTLDPKQFRFMAGSGLGDPQRGIVEGRGVAGVGRGVAFGPKGKTIFAVATTQDLQGGEVRGWNTADGREVFLQRRPHPLKSVEVSPDGRWLLLTAAGKPFELWLWRP